VELVEVAEEATAAEGRVAVARAVEEGWVAMAEAIDGIRRRPTR
jgi:hypothetical protein